MHTQTGSALSVCIEHSIIGSNILLSYLIYIQLSSHVNVILIHLLISNVHGNIELHLPVCLYFHKLKVGNTFLCATSRFLGVINHVYQ